MVVLSYRSQEWTLIPEDERKNLGLVFSNDGEFWSVLLTVDEKALLRFSRLACLANGLYIMLLFLFYWFLCFTGSTYRQVIWESILDRSSPNFHDLYLAFVQSDRWRDVAMATNSGAKFAKCPTTPSVVALALFKTDYRIAIPISELNGNVFPTLR